MICNRKHGRVEIVEVEKGNSEEVIRFLMASGIHLLASGNENTGRNNVWFWFEDQDGNGHMDLSQGDVIVRNIDDGRIRVWDRDRFWNEFEQERKVRISTSSRSRYSPDFLLKGEWNE